MKKLIILILIICPNLYVYCQNETFNGIHSIKELKVINSDVFCALDIIIQMKSEIQAYKETSFFTMEFGEDYIKKDLIFIRAYEKIEYNYPNILGFFDYKKHSFVVMGDSIDTTIFQKTNKKRIFDFGLPSIKISNGEPIVDQYETFAVWSIRYRLGRFKVLSFYTDNKSDHWFNYIDEEYNEK